MRQKYNYNNYGKLMRVHPDFYNLFVEKKASKKRYSSWLFTKDVFEDMKSKRKMFEL